MLDKRNKIEKEERAVLVGLIQKDQTEHQAEALARQEMMIQQLSKPKTVMRDANGKIIGVQ